MLDFYGEEGEDNDVSVNFSDKGFAGTKLVGGEIRVRLNLNAMKEAFSLVKANVSIEIAATLTHEGSHGNAIRDLGHNVQGYAETLNYEREGYRTQAYLNQGLNTASPYGVWHKGITDAEQAKAIEKWATISVQKACAGGKC